MSTKCYSKCRKVIKSECNPPKCAYTDGASRKYCRLNTKKYRLVHSIKDDKIVCNTTLKNNKVNRTSAALRINRFVNKHRKEKKSFSLDKKSVTLVKKTPTGVIGRFMRKTAKKRRAEFLKSICSDSGVCITFGQQSKKIIDFFLGFTDFTYLMSSKRVGSVSSNGFVNELKYERLGYEAHAILKSNRGPKNDNLVYEYVVGQYINKLCLQFPCFVETYGLYKYSSDVAWQHVRDTMNIGKNVLSGLMSLVKGEINNGRPEQWSDACLNSLWFSILIQHIKAAPTLKDMMTKVGFINNDLLYVLYQIYMPLSTLGNKYTHYDLHNENVMVYEPVRGKYIHYHYHLVGGDVVSFKSPYVAKIIDYGRSYFHDTAANNSKQIYNFICMLRDCRPNCGVNYGFTILKAEQKFGEFGYIVSQKPNISHDLRLLNMLKKNIPKHAAVSLVLDRVKYGVKVAKNMTEYGTKEDKTSGEANNTINNVHDAFNYIGKCIGALGMLNDLAYPDVTKKLGDLHVYSDGSPMRYVHAG